MPMPKFCIGKWGNKKASTGSANSPENPKPAVKAKPLKLPGKGWPINSINLNGPRKKKKVPLIKWPWKQNERRRIRAHRALILAEEKSKKKIKRMRVKFPERHKPITIGPGYPSVGLVYANMDIARGEKERAVLKSDRFGKPQIYEPLKTDLPHPVPDNVFEEFCKRIGIEQYKIEEPVTDPPNAIDLRAFDLYWEDIRVERNLIVKELRHLPLIAPIELRHLSVLEKSIRSISRSCYYSPWYSHTKSEDVVHLMVWFLNRRNLPMAFHIKVLQAVSLMVYISPIFKRELVKCGGVKVLNRLIQIGIIASGLQASWACYTLTMAAIGSPEVIGELQSLPDFDETIGELSFGMYWYYWPVNFASILQAIVYGPGGVANTLEVFEFL